MAQKLKKISQLKKRVHAGQGKYNYRRESDNSLTRTHTGYATDVGNHKLIYKSTDANGNLRLTKAGQEFYDSLSPKAQIEFMKYAAANRTEGITESRFISHLKDEEERFFFNLNTDKADLVNRINAKYGAGTVNLNDDWKILEQYVNWSYENGFDIR